MTLEGVDYSFGRPGGAALAAAGKRFAMRYIGTNDGKSATAAEIDDLHAHGLGVGFVFETSKARALSDIAGGKADGQRALTALKVLGVPDDRPAYFAVDFDATLDQFDVIESYLAGAGQVMGPNRVGVYAHARFVNVSHAARWFWQTYAWSGGAVSPRAHLLQYRNGQTINGAAVDFNRAFAADFGQWSPEEAVMAEAVVPFRSPVPFKLDGATRSFGATAPYPELDALSGTVQADATVVVSQSATPHGALVRVITGATGRRLVSSAAGAFVGGCTDQQLADARAAGRESFRKDVEAIA